MKWNSQRLHELKVRLEECPIAWETYRQHLIDEIAGREWREIHLEPLEAAKDQAYQEWLKTKGDKVWDKLHKLTEKAVEVRSEFQRLFPGQSLTL